MWGSLQLVWGQSQSLVYRFDLQLWEPLRGLTGGNPIVLVPGGGERVADKGDKARMVQTRWGQVGPTGDGAGIA